MKSSYEEAVSGRPSQYTWGPASERPAYGGCAYREPFYISLSDEFSSLLSIRAPFAVAIQGVRLRGVEWNARRHGAGEDFWREGILLINFFLSFFRHEVK